MELSKLYRKVFTATTGKNMSFPTNSVSSTKLFGHSARRKECTSPTEERNHCETEYHRAIAVELNNIAVDLFNNREYTKAMEFSSDAANALMIISDLDHHSPTYITENNKQTVALKIVQMKERLHTMASGENAKVSTLECKSGVFCISKAFKLILDDCPVEEHCAAVLYNMGLIHISLGSFEYGQQMFESVLSLASEYKSCQGNYMNLVLAAFNNLGWIHQRHLNFKDASNIYIQSLSYAIEIRTNQCIESAIFLASIVFNMGIMEASKGECERGLQLMMCSTKMMKEAVGEHHPDLACMLLNIGKFQFDLGLVSDSIKSFLEVIKIQRMVYGNEHFLVAEALYQLGTAFEYEGDYENALSAFEETARLEIAEFGPTHASVATTLSCIGRVQYERGELILAIQAFTKALIIIEEILNFDRISHAAFLKCLGKLYQENGMIEDSERCLLKSKRMLQELAPEHRGAQADIIIGLVEFDLAHPAAAATA